MRKRFRLVATGGTFDILHEGHYGLLSRSFQLGERVIIGITSDDYALKEKGCQTILHGYNKRARQLEHAIHSKFGDVKYTISKLENFYGPTVLSNEVEAIIASQETKGNGIKMNKLRKKNGLKLLKIITVSIIKSEDGLRLSSSRIRSGEIDSTGRLLKRVKNN
jgi:pantetheine-phosphate adenylyltransferase